MRNKKLFCIWNWVKKGYYETDCKNKIKDKKVYCPFCGGKIINMKGFVKDGNKDTL